MTNETGGQMSPGRNSLRRLKFKNLLHSEYYPATLMDQDDHNQSPHRNSSGSASSPRLSHGSPRSGDASPYLLSPWNQSYSPYVKSPWIRSSPPTVRSHHDDNSPRTGLLGSLVREEGHVYSLAASGNLLYTGSDSKNVRVWKNLKEFSGFKSNSGLVKAIVIAGDKVFTGHQDGKIRIWRYSRTMTNRKAYKRVGSLPTTKDFIKSSIRPKSYVRVRRHRNVPWIRHFDAVSSMSLDEEDGFLYSASWDKTLKVWRISDSKCLESINAHDDAVNAVVAGFHRLVFTGSADGTVKVWRREFAGKSNSNHVLAQVLLKQENAVTALAVDAPSEMVYCGSSNGLVKFWEREKRFSYGGVLRGHKLAVLCLAAAGNLVFSGSADKSICVWRRADGGVHTGLHVLTGHSGPVKCLAVAQDEDSSSSSCRGDQRWIVYSGSLDRSVKVWRVCGQASDS